MKILEPANATSLFIDIGQSSIQAVCGDDAFSFPLERGESGRLTDLCRERLTLSLRGFLSQKGRASERKAFCSIGARGVSIRRLSLPASSEEELQRVLRLQIESEFPLSPEQLAWGSRRIGPAQTPGNGAPARQEVLVVAVKKEALEEYVGILAACGVVPSFTLAALARAELHPHLFGSCSVLDIGRTHSELMTFVNGEPASIRILAWGGENITRSIQEKLGVGHDEAEKLKIALDQTAASGPSLQSAVESSLAALAVLIKPASLGEKLYLTGKSARDPRLASRLASVLGGGVSCEALPDSTGQGPSAAIAGLKKIAGSSGARAPLILTLNGGHVAAAPVRPPVWKWATAAVLLLLATLLFPYAEAIVMKPFLTRKLAALESDRGRLATIDQELDFLKFLKQNQPPYLDAIYLMARSAPPGARLEELSMGRRRDISLRMKMANREQVSDFRAKLVESGWFNNVIVEEQTPSPDRRLAVRMTAELKPAESRLAITPEPPRKKGDSLMAGPDPGTIFPPEPMMTPPVQPNGPPADAGPVVAPAPPPNGQDPSAAPVRRRIRRPTAPEP